MKKKGKTLKKEEDEAIFSPKKLKKT